jgi:hypothetical protein
MFCWNRLRMLRGHQRGGKMVRGGQFARTFPVLLALLGHCPSCLQGVPQHIGQPDIDRRRYLQAEQALCLARIRSSMQS